MYTELRREIDYGTPARISADSVTLGDRRRRCHGAKGHVTDARGRRGGHRCAKAMRDR